MKCTYQNTVFKNDTNGFSICIFATKDPSVPEQAVSRTTVSGKSCFTATGYHLPTTENIEYEMEGNWVIKDRFGMQLAVESCVGVAPQTETGLIGYLGSGLIKGIGPQTAKKIVQLFGMDALTVIENEPERLLKIPGITQEKLSAIRESLHESRAMQDIVSYLFPYGITVNKAARILKKFGPRSMEVLRTQPFKLCDVPGFGFKIVDEIARKTGCSLTDPLRIQSGVKFILESAASSKGHLFLPFNGLLENALLLLNDKLLTPAIAKDVLQKELKDMLNHGDLHMDAGNVFKAINWKDEALVARKVVQLLAEAAPVEGNISKELWLSQKRLGITLADKQIDAVKMWFQSPLSIITGGPGTGKTTVLRVILEIYKRMQPNASVLLAAPTGRASRKMTESTGFDAGTLHSTLGIMAEENEDEDEPTPVFADLMIVDEVSMIDMHLAAELFRRLKSGTQVLLVGDPDQLPSVGPGNVLRELIRCKAIPVTHLDFVYRQKDTSRIVINAHAINNGDASLAFGEDFILMPAENAAEAASTTIAIYMDELKKYGAENTQILAPFKARGAACVQQLNEHVRELVNPHSINTVELKIGSRIFRTGDKVLQTRNRVQEQISNGDIGFISQIGLNDDGSKSVLVNFSGNRNVSYTPDQLDQLELAYAMTIHKSQGAEYESVIIPILTEQSIMLRRNLIYTAITRAKTRLILVGQKKALYMAVNRNDVNRRNTLLADRIVSNCRRAGLL